MRKGNVEAPKTVWRCSQPDRRVSNGHGHEPCPKQNVVGKQGNLLSVRLYYDLRGGWRECLWRSVEVVGMFKSLISAYGENVDESPRVSHSMAPECSQTQLTTNGPTSVFQLIQRTWVMKSILLNGAQSKDYHEVLTPGESFNFHSFAGYAPMYTLGQTSRYSVHYFAHLFHKAHSLAQGLVVMTLKLHPA
jgi:hypothetical protein